nr:uncharacterized protein LOC112729918 [Arachis hypogaea]
MPQHLVIFFPFHQYPPSHQLITLRSHYQIREEHINSLSPPTLRATQSQIEGRFCRHHSPCTTRHSTKTVAPSSLRAHRSSSSLNTHHSPLTTREPLLLFTACLHREDSVVSIVIPSLTIVEKMNSYPTLRSRRC